MVSGLTFPPGLLMNVIYGEVRGKTFRQLYACSCLDSHEDDDVGGYKEDKRCVLCILTHDWDLFAPALSLVGS